MQMMENDLQRIRGQEQGLAEGLGRAVRGGEPAKSSLPFDINSEPSHWLSQVLSSERDVENGRQELTGRISGHEPVEGSSGKTEGREGGREGDIAIGWLNTCLCGVTSPHTIIAIRGWRNTSGLHVYSTLRTQMAPVALFIHVMIAD